MQSAGKFTPATCAGGSQRAARSALSPLSASPSRTLSAVQSPRLWPPEPGICRTECAVNKLQSNRASQLPGPPHAELCTHQATCWRRRGIPSRQRTEEETTPVQALGQHSRDGITAVRHCQEPKVRLSQEQSTEAPLARRCEGLAQRKTGQAGFVVQL